MVGRTTCANTADIEKHQRKSAQHTVILAGTDQEELSRTTFSFNRSVDGDEWIATDWHDLWPQNCARNCGAIQWAN